MAPLQHFGQVGYEPLGIPEVEQLQRPDRKPTFSGLGRTDEEPAESVSFFLGNQAGFVRKNRIL
jgi:hypothetical protein